MKGLHKKIGVGVLVSGLLIGGVSFSSGSISHASSDISLGLEIESLLSVAGVELPPELEAFLQGGHKGLLDYDSNLFLRPKLSNMDQKDREVFGSILGLGSKGNYSVIGFKLGGQRHSIPYCEKYWGSGKHKLVNINFDKLIKVLRNESDEQRKQQLKKLGLDGDGIYKLKFDNEHEVLIAIL